jgi:ribosomal protein L11 methyltransferase
MPWRALELEVDAAHAEALGEALLELGAQSVATEDADAGSAQEAPLYAEPVWGAAAAWRRNRICALFGLDVDVAVLVAAAAQVAGLEPIPAFRTSRVEDEDWVRRTQAQFGPLRIGEHLWIVPSWSEPPREEGVVVRLDPGLAFGTGSHPSTRLALAWLAALVRGGERLLDYGCGSGILALAAAKLGAAEVAAVDLDPQAREAAAANAQANGVPLGVFAPEALPAGDYDLLVANILAQPLIGLAPVFAARTRAGARIALSGILASQAGEVAAAYAAAFDLTVAAAEEDWVLLAGGRR